MEPLVSIIIPIYNVEKYLDRCISSVINQTYKNIEIILVNDGSKDGCLQICESYKASDSRVRLISQDNAGVSVARNTGIDAVNGRYVYFMDGDDSIEVDAIEKLLGQASDSDLVITGFCEIDEEDNVISRKCQFPNVQITNTQMISNLFSRTSEFGYQGYLWNKLFDAKIIKENNLNFDAEIHYNEDRLFVLEYLLKCKKVTIIPVCTYKYRMRDGSAMSCTEMGKKNFSPKLLTEISAFKKMQELLLKNHNDEYIAVAREIYICGLELYKKIPKQYKQEKTWLQEQLLKNLKLCLFDNKSKISGTQKVKFVLKWILKG